MSTALFIRTKRYATIILIKIIKLVKENPAAIDTTITLNLDKVLLVKFRISYKASQSINQEFIIFVFIYFLIVIRIYF